MRRGRRRALTHGCLDERRVLGRGCGHSVPHNLTQFVRECVSFLLALHSDCRAETLRRFRGHTGNSAGRAVGQPSRIPAVRHAAVCSDTRLQQVRKADLQRLSSNAADVPNGSPDGRFVLFASSADNSVLMTNGSRIPTQLAPPFNVYLRDRTNGTTTLVSVNLSGTNGGNCDSLPAGLSSDGPLRALREQRERSRARGYERRGGRVCAGPGGGDDHRGEREHEWRPRQRHLAQRRNDAGRPLRGLRQLGQQPRARRAPMDSPTFSSATCSWVPPSW